MGWGSVGTENAITTAATARLKARWSSEYCGCGERAANAAAAIAGSRAQRHADHQEAVQQEQVTLGTLSQLSLEFIEVTQVLLEATLLAHGFHRRNYGGKWRKKRGSKEEK